MLANGTLTSLPVPNFKSATKQDVIDYFDNTWLITEVIFSGEQVRQAGHLTGATVDVGPNARSHPDRPSRDTRPCAGSQRRSCRFTVYSLILGRMHHARPLISIRALHV